MKCMADSKENYYTSEILGMKGFTAPHKASCNFKPNKTVGISES